MSFSIGKCFRFIVTNRAIQASLALLQTFELPPEPPHIRKIPTVLPDAAALRHQGGPVGAQPADHLVDGSSDQLALGLPRIRRHGPKGLLLLLRKIDLRSNHAPASREGMMYADNVYRTNASAQRHSQGAPSRSVIIPAELVPACSKRGAGIQKPLNLQELDSR